MSLTLKQNDPMPQFEGHDENGNLIKSSDFKDKKLIIFFYPADNTPGCTAEACSLRDGYAVLKAKGYQLIGVSPDNGKKHQGFIAKFSLPFPLIADTEKVMLNKFGVWGSKKFMGKTFDGVLRTTFIIDENGIITHIISKVKTNDHTQQILELIEG
ncbi:MAG: thioredoxin-dependent thiol peroxidase [Saprospiraceae bacterium]|nr:thioredoxin-dependent thiol peroxidase [Saprospiraceae bacterium]